MTRKEITISTVCRKGGVGKTLTTANVAALLSDKTDKNILVIDCDGQSSLTEYYLKHEPAASLPPEQTAAAFFDDSVRIDPNKMIHTSHKRGLHIVPSNDALTHHNWPNIAEQPEKRTHAIRRFVDLLGGHFEYILIDTGPQLRTLPNWAALVAADYALCPVVPECFAGKAIAPVQRFIREAQKVNASLHLLGYAINMLDPRYGDHQEAVNAIRRQHEELIFDTVTPRLADYQKAINQRLAITDYKRNSNAAEIAETLTKEIYTRILRHRNQREQHNKRGKEAA